MKAPSLDGASGVCVLFKMVRRGARRKMPIETLSKKGENET